MDLIDSRPHPIACNTDGLDSHDHSTQSPLSDLRRSAVRDDFVLDLISSQFTNKVTFWYFE